MKYNYGHFPIGTVCVVKVGLGPEKEIVVKNIVGNGPCSYCILTSNDEYYNIDWVVRIIKRGQGTLCNPIRERETEYNKILRSYYNDVSDILRQLGVCKSKKHYVGFSLKLVVVSIIEKHSDEVHLIDTDKLLHMVYMDSSVIKYKYSQKPNTFKINIFVINKKKLVKLVKRLLPKCRLKRKVTQKEHDFDL